MAGLDSIRDGPAIVLSEVMQGLYENLLGNIEPGEHEAYVRISGPDHDWLLTIQKVPEETQSVERHVEVVS